MREKEREARIKVVAEGSGCSKKRGENPPRVRSPSMEERVVLMEYFLSFAFAMVSTFS